MSKVNSILNYLKSYQDGIEGLRHNVPGFTFSGFTFTVNTETISGVEKQVIDVFGIVNNDLDNKSMEAINLTVPSLKQSVSRISTTNYASIIKERNSPIYYNRKIEIVTDNNPVDNDMELVQDENGSATSGTSNQLISDDLPEMGIYTTSTNVYYRVKSIYPDWSKDSADEQLEGNNEVSGDEVAHDSGHDLTEQEAKEILDNMLGKNEEFNALTDVLDKLFKADTFPEDQPKTLKELIDIFQDGDTPEEPWKQQHENTPKDDTKKPDWDKITVFIPEEHLTLTDEDEFDITFDTDIDAMNTRVTVINIKGINNMYFFNTGHTLTLTTQAGDLAGDITTGFIADVETDEDGLHVWVSEQLPTPSPTKDELSTELKHEGINSDPNKKTPIEYYAKGEPGVEGKPVHLSSEGTIQGKTIQLGNTSISFGDKTARITADKITLEGVTIEQEPRVDVKNNVTDVSGTHTLGELFNGLDGK